MAVGLPQRPCESGRPLCWSVTSIKQGTTPPSAHANTAHSMAAPADISFIGMAPADARQQRQGGCLASSNAARWLTSKKQHSPYVSLLSTSLTRRPALARASWAANRYPIILHILCPKLPSLRIPVRSKRGRIASAAGFCGRGQHRRGPV